MFGILYVAACGCAFALNGESTDSHNCGIQGCPLWANWRETEDLLWLAGVALSACWSPGYTDPHHGSLTEALAAYRHPEALRSLTAVEAASLAARVTGYWGYGSDQESVFGSPGMKFDDEYKVSAQLPVRVGAA